MSQEDDNYGSKKIGGSKNLKGTDWGGRTWKLMCDGGGRRAIQKPPDSMGAPIITWLTLKMAFFQSISILTEILKSLLRSLLSVSAKNLVERIEDLNHG